MEEAVGGLHNRDRNGGVDTETADRGDAEHTGACCKGRVDRCDRNSRQHSPLHSVSSERSAGPSGV